MSKVKNSIILFALAFLFSCSKDRDALSENAVDPNFVPSTTQFNLLDVDLSNLDCFYENNFVEIAAESELVKSISWYIVQDSAVILLSQEKKQIIDKAGNYRAKLQLTVDGQAVDSVLNFKLNYCDVLLVIPVIFNPNGDGNYDFWAPVGKGIDNVSFTVTNRRNKTLFESTSLDVKWNGKYDNKNMPSGTYRYYVHGTYKNGYLFEKKGTFELTR